MFDIMPYRACLCPILALFVPVCLQDVSDVFKVLSNDNTTLRHAAAELVVQLLEDQGRASIQAAAEALQVGAELA